MFHGFTSFSPIIKGGPWTTLSVEWGRTACSHPQPKRNKGLVNFSGSVLQKKVKPK